MKPAYENGQSMFFALKRRETRLRKFKLIDCQMAENIFYYFTSFVRSHDSF
jgi:hypothetical protein